MTFLEKRLVDALMRWRLGDPRRPAAILLAESEWSDLEREREREYRDLRQYCPPVLNVYGCNVRPHRYVPPALVVILDHRGGFLGAVQLAPALEPTAVAP